MNTKQFKKLLKQIFDGNKRALEPIYEEYYEKMVLTAKCILKNEKDAQDAASDVILKIFKMATEKGECNIKNVGAYIYVAVTNAAKDIYRIKSRETIIDFLDNVSAKDELENSINRLSLNDALEKLSESEREIAILYYFYDYKIIDISKSLERPIGTIKWKLGEIKKKLYNFLK